MNTLKKLSAGLLVLLVVVSSVWATTPVGPGMDANAPYYSVVGEAFEPTSSRVLGMGGAGIAVASRADSMYLNPASLGAREFMISVPSVAVTIFNPQQVLAQGMVDDLLAIASDSNAALTALQKYLGIISTKGYNEVVTTDVSVGFTAGGFGFGVQAQEQLHSYNPDGKTTSTLVIGEGNVAAALGFGWRFHFAPDSLSLDVGLMARFNYRVYTSAVTADSILALMPANGSAASNTMLNDFLNKTPLMAGWAIPIDVGVTLNMPYGFSTALVARNLNGKFYMNAYPGISNWGKELFGKPFTSDNSVGTGTVTAFQMNTPWSLDLGFGWDPDFGKVNNFIKPVIAIDFADMVGFFANDLSWEGFLTHLNMGAEVRLLSFLDIRAGLRQGYMSLGAGVDIFIIRVDAAYTWQEFGVALGDKPIDSFTIRFNIGFDR